jgi:hypothetical protein
LQLSVGGDQERGLSGAAFGIGINATRPVERQIAQGSATLLWLLGQVTACPISIRFGRALTLFPCARFDLGRVQAAGSGIVGAHTRDLFWLAAGAEGELVFTLWEPFVLEARLGALFPLQAHDFKFDPDLALFTRPKAGVFGALGIGVIFL